MTSPQVIATFVELRKENVSTYYGSRSLSADLFERIAELCDSYLLESDAGREAMRAQVSFEISFLFFMFSGHAAELAVRGLSEKLVTQGIIALLIENGTFDSRDSIIALSMVYDAASRVGLAAQDFFVRMSGLGGDRMRDQLVSFAKRAPEQQALRLFELEAGTDSSGNFIYTALKK